MKLDKRGRELLGILQTDAKQSLTALGNKLTLSKEAVAYRIKQLEKKKVITSFSTLLNGSLLGYIYFKVFLKFDRVTPVEEQDVIDYLLSMPGVVLIRCIEGDHDLAFIYMAPSVASFREFLNELTLSHGVVISERHIMLLTKIHHYVHRFFLPSDNIGAIYTLSDVKPSPLDDIDFHLLEELSKDCRITTTSLAELLGVDRSTLRYRKKKLEAARVIIGYQAQIDSIALGFLCVHLHATFFNLAETDNVIAFFKDMGVCTLVYESIGEYDLSLELLFQNDEERRQAIEAFRARFAKKLLRYDLSHVHTTYDAGWTPYVPKKE